MGEDGWKSSLNAQQQNKVLELEKQREILKKELDKKSMSADILQQTLEKEKRKIDEEKSNTNAVQKELQSIRERLSELERKNEKLTHDLSAKETLNTSLQVKQNNSF